MFKVINVAKSEAENSLVIISEATQPIRNPTDKQRLILESPCKTLDVLLDMPSFLERGSKDIVSELLTLNTSLKWSVTCRPPGSSVALGSTTIVTANRKAVLDSPKQVIKLLEEQLQRM